MPFVCNRIDATDESISGMARYVNDSLKQPNSRTKKIEEDSLVYVCLFALFDIPAGTEIRYDYGPGDFAWRHQVC